MGMIIFISSENLQIILDDGDHIQIYTSHMMIGMQNTQNSVKVFAKKKTIEKIIYTNANAHACLFFVWCVLAAEIETRTVKKRCIDSNTCTDSHFIYSIHDISCHVELGDADYHTIYCFLSFSMSSILVENQSAVLKIYYFQKSFWNEFRGIFSYLYELVCGNTKHFQK